jgi:hypothetical protein
MTRGIIGPNWHRSPQGEGDHEDEWHHAWLPPATLSESALKTLFNRLINLLLAGKSSWRLGVIPSLALMQGRFLMLSYCYDEKKTPPIPL